MRLVPVRSDVSPFFFFFFVGAVQKASALLSVVVGAILYYWLYALGLEEHHMGGEDDKQDFLSAHSYVVFFGFAGVFAVLAMAALSTVAAQIQHQAEPPKPESKLKKFKGARKGPAKVPPPPPPRLSFFFVPGCLR